MSPNLPILVAQKNRKISCSICNDKSCRRRSNEKSENRQHNSNDMPFQAHVCERVVTIGPVQGRLFKLYVSVKAVGDGGWLHEEGRHTTISRAVVVGKPRHMLDAG